MGVVAVVLLAGCASANFDIAAPPSEDAMSDVASLESAVLADSSDPLALVDGCSPNGCGGCAPLAKPPGSACGICGTSSFECTGATSTACKAPDDRARGTYNVNTAADRAAVTIAPSGGAAISFAMPRTGSVTSISFSIQRASLSHAGVEGTLRVRLMRGAPTLTPVSTDILATANIAASSIPTSAAIGTVLLPATLPIVVGEQPLWIEFTSSSDACQFVLLGSSSGGEPPILERTTKGYVRTSSMNAYLTLEINACW